MSGSSEPGTPAANPLNAVPLAGIRRLSAKDSVRARIALAVDLGLLAPGERLPSISAVASALEVGEVTVRRAFESLAGDGVLQGRRGRGGGTFVAADPPTGVVREVAAYTADTATVHRLIDQRLLLECGAAHLAALHATPQRLGELQELVDDMDATTTWTRFRELDTRFHHLVADTSGVAHAQRELSEVLGQLHEYFLPYRMDVLHQSNRDHRDLVGALRGGAPDDAVRITHRHVTALRRTMFVGFTTGGEGEEQEPGSPAG
ncbi:GntR family transcriptional regulator [Haloactinospora alba]|uniref:GntR family transcriptional regulator n=1 Tax=Haloactinospora alba TaxID=405555 RepID=A0A543NNR9_9ACTN|nr:FCD domain-containing protein [Haloactinospora alba]TQN33427.1 GntR family transcriptional regulator [Haloactinospora alba]